MSCDTICIVAHFPLVLLTCLDRLTVLKFAPLPHSYYTCLFLLGRFRIYHMNVAHLGLRYATSISAIAV